MSHGNSPSADLLGAIVAATRRIVETRRAARKDAELERAAARQSPRGGLFREALSRVDHVNVIAECKRRSPSRGVLRMDYDPVSIATAYEAAGAAAISVLTEPTFFDGSLKHLEAVRDAISIPVLRKDFLVDRYQLLEARAAGADAVLLIVAALSRRSLEDLLREAGALRLATLVEAHDERDLEVALECGAPIIGVNNRDLRSLDVDVSAAERLIRLIRGRCIAVAESGLKTHGDVKRLRAAGYDAFLVGERLMTSADPGSTLRTLIGPDKGHEVSKR
jgi:indole-3-glycerol phosphate synthase